MTGSLAAPSDGTLPAAAIAAPAMPALRNSRREAPIAASFRVFRLSLLAVDREGQQDVAGRSAGRVVAGVEVDHPPADGRARTVERSAPRRDTVDRLVRTDGVEVPEHRTVGGGVGAHVPVHRSGKRDARKRADG